MRKCMKRTRSRRKRSPCDDWSADRAVMALVLLAVTLVLVLVGFSGTSVYITRPGPKEWLYIGTVITAAAVTLFWLFYLDGKRTKGNPPGSGKVNPRSRRSLYR